MVISSSNRSFLRKFFVWKLTMIPIISIVLVLMVSIMIPLKTYPPSPEFPIPPNGRYALAKCMRVSFTIKLPDWMLLITRSMNFLRFENTYKVKGFSTFEIIDWMSENSLNFRIGKSGPKISSFNKLLFLSSSPNIVGSINLSAKSYFPPKRILSFFCFKKKNI